MVSDPFSLSLFLTFSHSPPSPLSRVIIIIMQSFVTFCPGSGGNNHAVDYYDETKYPLAVKLGTITPDGADIYSYDEDNMVEDPRLSQHLAHFGIDITSMTKV